ncbi:uncharacterized protein CLUP02_01873, partial [Colletotrichum lupini]
KKGIELTRTIIKRLKTLYSVISKYNNNIKPTYTFKSALKVSTINIRLPLSIIFLNLKPS